MPLETTDPIEDQSPKAHEEQTTKKPTTPEDVAYARVVDEVALDYTTELFSTIVAQLPPEPTLILSPTDAFFEQVDTPVLQRVASEQRVVILDKARPLNESIEQLIMKEIESTWINELQRYESLKED